MSKKNFISDLFDDPVIYDVKNHSSNKYWVGIDNGVSGSIAIIKPDGTVFFEKVPVKTEQSYTKAKQNISRIKVLELAEILKINIPEGGIVRVVIERPMVNVTRFKASASGLRALEATLIVVDDMLHFPYSYIDSRIWQKVLLPSGVNGEDLKKASLDIGNRLFPQFRDMKHPDRDGLLIAEYARRMNL
jgi:hypothetical protein